jgi:hypothetical protein
MMRSPARKKRSLAKEKSEAASSVGSPPPASAPGESPRRRLSRKTGAEQSGGGPDSPEAIPRSLDEHHALLYKECSSIHERFPGLTGLRLLNQINRFYRCMGYQKKICYATRTLRTSLIA